MALAFNIKILGTYNVRYTPKLKYLQIFCHIFHNNKYIFGLILSITTSSIPLRIDLFFYIYFIICSIFYFLLAFGGRGKGPRFERY